MRRYPQPGLSRTISSTSTRTDAAVPGRGQDRPVGPRQPQGLDLTLEHGDLVPQDQDLGVLGTVGAGEQGKPAEHAQHRQVGKS
jgi:hypothetical protein